MIPEKLDYIDYLRQDKLYIQRAKIVLPYLVRQAKLGEPIFYSDLATEIGMPNARNLNYVLLAVGKAIEMLNKTMDVKVPPLQSLVFSKTTKLPSPGFDIFLKDPNFRKQPKIQQQTVINDLIKIMRKYPDWDWMLKQLRLEPLQ